MRDEVRDLLTRAPRAPEDDLPVGATDDVIEAFETRLRIRIPPALREWLQLTNGARMGLGGLFGIATASRSLEIEEYLAGYPEWRENGWLPVAGDGNGNYYVLAAGRDDGRTPVLFIDTHDDPAEVAYIAASDLWHFLRFLLRKECGEHGWPFIRDKVVADDPAIASFDDLPQPWDA